MSVLQTLMPVTFQKHKMCLAGAVYYCLIVLLMKENVEPVEEVVILWVSISKVPLQISSRLSACYRDRSCAWFSSVSEQ
jgi:hypothetical protein